MRSLLCVSADHDGALEEAAAAGADALIVDLPGRAHVAALDRLRRFQQGSDADGERPLVFVRIDSIDALGIDELLGTLVSFAPDGILLRGCRGGHDVQHLAVKVAVHEATHGLEDGSIGIVADASATARSILMLDSFCQASARLMALYWDASVLAAEFGFAGEADETVPSPVRTARDLVLLAARAAEIGIIEGPTAESDDAAFASACRLARRDGFNAKAGRTSESIAIINTVFDR